MSFHRTKKRIIHLHPVQRHATTPAAAIQQHIPRLTAPVPTVRTAAFQSP